MKRLEKFHISAGSGVEEIVDANSLSDKLIQLLIYLDVDADTVVFWGEKWMFFFWGGGGGIEDFLLDEFDVVFFTSWVEFWGFMKTRPGCDDEKEI